jgi:hypothetical protein
MGEFCMLSSELVFVDWGEQPFREPIHSNKSSIVGLVELKDKLFAITSAAEIYAII